MLLEREDVNPDIEPNTAQPTFPGGGVGLEGLVKILLELGDDNLGLLGRYTFQSNTSLARGQVAC